MLHLVDDPTWTEVERINETYAAAKNVFEYNAADEALRTADPEVRELWDERESEAVGLSDIN
jgi:hypothetical protein